MFHVRTAAWMGSLALSVCANASPSVQELFPKFDIFTTNNSGFIAGKRNDPITFGSHGVIRGFAETVFDVPGAISTEVYDLNNSRVAVGAAFDGSFTAFKRSAQGVITKYKYRQSEYSVFNSITDSGLILGWQYTDEENYGAFVLTPTGHASPFIVRGYEDANWTKLNNNKQVLGSGLDPIGGFLTIGLLYSDGVVEEISFPDAEHVLMVDLNNKGDVLGEAAVPFDPETGFSPSVAFVRKANGTIQPISYQPKWEANLIENIEGRTVSLQFSHTLGTSAKAMDDNGRVIFSSLAYYTEPGFPIGYVKERIFAIRL